MKRIVLTYLALLALLAATLLLHDRDLGRWQTEAALGIAALKAIFIAWVFMGLRSTVGISRVSALAGLLWLMTFYFLAGLDIIFRA